MSPDFSSLAADLVYHDYVAMLCSLDDAHSIRTGIHSETPQLAVNFDFTTQCREYLKRLNRNLDDWHATRPGRARTPAFAPYLYNPASFIAFGYTDNISLVLLDDFDPLMAITADIRSPVEQAALAFCPTLASLRLAPGPDSPFAELHELLKGEPRKWELDGKKGFLPGSHPFEEKMPLLAVTKYRVGGLAILGHGVLLQQAIFRAMAARIQKVLHDLRTQYTPAREESLLERGDLEHVKCVFLDAQGSEDIITFVACRNYTVAIALVTALRTLTFADLFDAEPRLREVLDAAPMHRGVLHVFRKVRPQSARRSAGPLSIDELRDNHVFSTTYTTLGVSNAAYMAPDKYPCHGVIEPYCQFDVNPGHLLSVEDRIARAQEGMGNVLPDQQQQRRRNLGPYLRNHRFLVGRHDYAIPLYVNPGSASLFAQDVGVFFKSLHRLCDGLRDRAGKGPCETGIMDMSTSIVVPFPRVRVQDAGGERDLILVDVGPAHQPLMSALERIRRRLFDHRAHAPRKGKHAKARTARFDPEKLQDQLRALEVPLSLRRTIIYLYQNFANCLADPFLFDSVLDLYDTFAALHAFLDQSVIEHSASFGEKMIDDLEDMLSALHNALSHRIALTIPNIEGRDMAVDFRGGLTRLVAAADVPLKCGLGLLKWIQSDLVEPEEDPRRAGDNGFPLDSVAAVVRITFHPRALCRRVRFNEDLPIWLAHLDMNVGHLFNPTEFANQLHETAHLILEWVRQDNSPLFREGRRLLKEAENLDPRRSALPAMRERVEEVFAGMLTHLLVFGADSPLFLRYYIAGYSVHPISLGATPEARQGRFIELMARGFLIADAVHQASEGRAEVHRWTTRHPLWGKDAGASLRPVRLQEARERFRAMLNEVGPFARDHSEFWSGADEVHRKFCLDRFEDVYRVTLPHAAGLWNLALTIYQEFLRDGKFPGGPGFRRGPGHELTEAVRRAMEEGRPCLRGLYPSPVGGRQRRAKPPTPVEHLFLVCHLVYSYLDFCFQHIRRGRAMHVYRDQKGKVRFAEGLRHSEFDQWNDLQLDRAYGGLFCVDPRLRREKLRRQIVVLKSLWDMSTSLRARRLLEILKDNWPDLPG